jgi:DNA recombination protein RmuC
MVPAANWGIMWVYNGLKQKGLEVAMEVVIIVLLAVLIVLFLWDRLWRRRKLEEQGEALSKEVGDRIDGSIKVFGELQKGLGELTEKTKSIEDMGRNILGLQEILQAPKRRGGLGELLLESLLADMLPPGYYELQRGFRNGEVVVDAVVRVGDSFVPIDAKFPLEDFQRMAAAGSEKEQETAKNQFVRTVKRHIDNVAKYILPDENTFGFALMYVPAENIYYETICQSEICAHCLDKKVFLVSPNSFNAYLQAIVLGLKGLRIEKATHEILRRLESLKGDFAAFQRDYDTLGRHINQASAKYGEASIRLTKLGTRLQVASTATVGELEEGDAEMHEQDGQS